MYADEEEAETLEILMEDNVTGLRVVLYYGVLPAHDIITRAVKVVNFGEKPVHISKIQSACLDFVTGDFDCLSFYGRHVW